ncbi:MAG: DUF6279 family lipoprotein [Pseudomonadota bacterium]
MKNFNMHSPTIRRFRAFCLIAVVVLAAGCSSFRLGYNNGDTLMYWWLNSYLDFDSDQSGTVKKDIAKIFQWHRKSELDDYGRLLAKAKSQLAGRPTQADLLTDYREAMVLSMRVANYAIPEMARMARSAKPAQIANMEEKFASTNETYRKKFLSGDVEKRQKVRYKKSMQQLELWFGSFSNDQEAALRKASDARPLNNEFWFEERVRRQKAILAALRKIQGEKLSQEASQALIQNLIKDMFERFEAPDRKPFFDASIAGTNEMVLTAIRIATPEQKAHAQKRMQGWIDDFNELAAAVK